MKKQITFCCLAITMLAGLLGCGTAHKAADSSEQSAEQWFEGKQWGKGLSLKVYPSVNKEAFYEQYHKSPELWEKAFAYLKKTDLEAIQPGKYPIQGDSLFATVTEGPDKEFDKTGWESHRKYIDLQYIIRGKEKMGVAPVASAQVIKPYDEKKDVANYTAEGVYYTAAPGTYFLFFPSEAHRPSIKVEGYDVVKKIVLKIRVAD